MHILTSGGFGIFTPCQFEVIEMLQKPVDVIDVNQFEWKQLPSHWRAGLELSSELPIQRILQSFHRPNTRGRNLNGAEPESSDLGTLVVMNLASS